MRLRQAKKRLWWSKGEGDYISNHRSKNHHENYRRKYMKLRPGYYDKKRGGWVYPSCADIDIVRRANVRLGRWIRKGKKLKEQLKKDMKELINVAEELYKQIDKAQVHLINARLSNDEEGKKLAISEVETTMCNAIQLLTCLVERKDNIVDLEEVWHDITEEPLDGNTIVYLTKNHAVGALKRVDNHRFARYIDKYAICKWAYMKGLLPKGGE